MLKNLIYYDKQLLVFLNNLGNSTYDNFWLIITKQFYWTPFFFVLLYLLYIKIGAKKTALVLVLIALLLLCCNESVEFFKFTFKRLRPFNDLEIKNLVRKIYQANKTIFHSDTFSFFSGHAANSMASMVVLFLILRNYYRYAFLIFLYPLIFAYSRIYLGAHFVSDIIVGYLFGLFYGYLFYKLYTYLLLRFRF